MSSIGDAYSLDLEPGVLSRERLAVLGAKERGTECDSVALATIRREAP